MQEIADIPLFVGHKHENSVLAQTASVPFSERKLSVIRIALNVVFRDIQRLLWLNAVVDVGFAEKKFEHGFHAGFLLGGFFFRDFAVVLDIFMSNSKYLNKCLTTTNKAAPADTDGDDFDYYNVTF